MKLTLIIGAALVGILGLLVGCETVEELPPTHTTTTTTEQTTVRPAVGTVETQTIRAY
jgi:hypothetical protein